MVKTNGNGENEYKPAVEFEYLDADVWFEVVIETGEKRVTYSEDILKALQEDDEESDSSND